MPRSWSARCRAANACGPGWRPRWAGRHQTC
ncbi:hypothetical protein RB2654_14705 [Rhodobacterales bacterium HTCC2654]|uniref:Uncharacterized protein n=1 Tax=Maritimibacter alkaliphilus HTCC2654 TaxID=314271 RepID=A3VGZ0_9RHOB|nr:hypothetical protein RB2654_14705 [Rhodobacterales bacterium HTCC2654] [Maritimibacter alkaliphilus HTCC2654]